jgi:hypothetical protein
VPVKAVIEGGPVLVVEPKILDFGEVVRGTAAGGTLAVRNGGSGKLSWQCTIDSGIFFDVEPAEDRVAVSLREASEGTYHGSIRIKSNGGEATVDVRARVVPPRQSNLIQPPVTEAAVGPGQWQIDVVAFGVPQAQLVATFLPNGALAGMQQALGMNVPIQGRWVYDIAQRQLGLEVYGPGFGDVVVIQIVGQQGNVLQGHNGRGFTYVLTSLA